MTPRASINRLFHRQVREIAAKLTFAGRHWQEDSWKRFLIEAWVTVERDDARASGMSDPFPGLCRLEEGIDGASAVQLGVQTRTLTQDQLSCLVEATYAAAIEMGMEWSTPHIEEGRQAMEGIGGA